MLTHVRVPVCGTATKNVEDPLRRHVRVLPGVDEQECAVGICLFLRAMSSRPSFPQMWLRGTLFFAFLLALVVKRKAKMPCSIAVKPFSSALPNTTRKILRGTIFFFFEASDNPHSWSACLNFLEV
jgi:hypothetical protein